MPRIRTIKPEFFTSLTIADLPIRTRLTFIGLWTHVDDHGRCIADARLLKAALWPLDDEITAHDLEEDLHLLDEASLITRYTLAEDSTKTRRGLDRRTFLAVTGWGEHQKIDRPGKPKCPPPEKGVPLKTEPPLQAHDQGKHDTRHTLDESSSKDQRGLDEPSSLEQGTGKGTGNREQGSSDDSLRSSSSSEIAARPSDTEKRDDVERLCTHLADRIEANGAKRPTITQKWRQNARRLLDLDGRSEEQVCQPCDL